MEVLQVCIHAISVRAKSNSSFWLSTGIGHGVAAAALSNGASVVISSSSQPKVDAAVERLKQSIEGKRGITVTGQVFDIRDYGALTGFLTKEAPFDHLVCYCALYWTPCTELIWLICAAGNHCRRHTKAWFRKARG